MKKLCYMAAFGGLVLISCNKENDINKPQSAAASEDHKVKRQESEGCPMRKFVINMPECVFERENCCPYDVTVEDRFFDGQDYNNGHGWIRIGDWVWEWKCTGNDELPFRTSDYNGKFASNFSFSGIHTQEEINQLDNEAFYRTLFRGLDGDFVRMLYSPDYRTALVHNKKTDRSYLFVVRKGVEPQDGLNHPDLVIPFTKAQTK